jgi:hypothetical protein
MEADVPIQPMTTLPVEEPDMTTDPKTMKTHGIRVALGLINAKIRNAPTEADLNKGSDFSAMRIRHTALMSELKLRKD